MRSVRFAARAHRGTRDARDRRAALAWRCRSRQAPRRSRDARRRRAPQRAARGRLRPLLPPHVDRLRPERRADDGLRGLREPAQPHRRADAPKRARSAPRSARSAFRSARCSRARSAARAKPRELIFGRATASPGGARRSRAGRRRRYAELKLLLRDAGARRRQSRDREPRQSVRRRRRRRRISPKAKPR